METDILTIAHRLPDEELLARLHLLASREREASSDLVAHLAALDARPAVYSAEGYGSLFGYCTQALRLSEDAACNRIEAARACRRFPVILGLLATGSMSLTSVRLLARHLTPANHQDVLARACGRTRREIDLLLAELAPRPDVPAFVRKLPVRDSGHTKATSVSAEAVSPHGVFPAPSDSTSEGRSWDQNPISTIMTPDTSSTGSAVSCETPAPVRRPIVQATAPDRYRMQFTIGTQAHGHFRLLQALLRREIPDGDPGAIVERALALLLEKVEKTKLAAATRPRPAAIRPGTDGPASLGNRPAPAAVGTSRYVPRGVRRAVWSRDAGQCAFQAAGGGRCSERAFLEFHHVQPYARQGEASVANISLRCRRHNQYEAERVFGPRGSG